MSDKQLLRIFIILSFCLAIVMRLALLNWELPYYSVDENDVVEPALAFLSGDWEPHWYGYGPLFSYLLAFIYKIWMWTTAVTLGWTKGDFFYSAFFEPTSFYVIARAFHAFIVIGIACVSWLFARRNFDFQTSVVAFILGLSPFLDINTNFKIRVDTLLGLMSLLSLFFATQFGKDMIKPRPYIMSGIFAGLCIATKTLPGLLVLPALVFGHFLSVWQTKDLSAMEKIKFAVIQPNLWILACSAILAHSLVNPYSIINFKGFLLEIYNVFTEQSAGGEIFNFFQSPYDFSWLVSKWGWPMVIAVILALLASLRRPDNASRILLVYIAVFCTAFFAFKIRYYWYNAVFPAVILLVARLVSDVSQSVGKSLLNLRKMEPEKMNYDTHMRLFTFVMILFIMILIYFPLRSTGYWVHANWFSPSTALEKRADHAAQLWIESNLPSHSSILMIGRHALNLPRIIADKAKDQAVWGEYFSYHRDKSLPWRKVYEDAYLRLQKTDKPTYSIINIRERYSNDPRDLELNSFYRNNMVSIAWEKGCNYIVIASPKEYKGTWEEESRVKLISFFNRDSGYKGDEIKIFEVLP